MFFQPTSVSTEQRSYSPIFRTSSQPLTLVDPALAAVLHPAHSPIGKEKILKEVVPAWKGTDLPVVRRSDSLIEKKKPTSAESCEDEIGKCFKDGRTAFRFGDYPEALSLFKNAYALIRKDHRAIVAYHIGICMQRMLKFDEAISYYFEYLAFGATNSSDRHLTLEQVRLARSEDPITLTHLPPTSDATDEIEEEARACFKTARMVFELQDYGSALEKFTEAYKMANVPKEIREAIVYNMAVCHQALGWFNTAKSFYYEYAMYTTNSQNQLEALQQIAECRMLNRTDRLAATSPKCSISDQGSLFQAATEIVKQGEFRRALNKFQGIYTNLNMNEGVRSAAIYNIGMCYQRLGEYEKTIGIILEYLLFPNLSENDRREGLLMIQHARQKNIGTHLQLGNLSPDRLEEGEQLLMTGTMFMKSGSAEVSMESHATLQKVARLLQEYRAKYPTADIRISLVGSSSRRWRNAGAGMARRNNMELARNRAEAVSEVLQEKFEGNNFLSGGFILSTDAVGASLAKYVVDDVDDNYWRYRKVTLTVWIRDGELKIRM